MNIKSIRANIASSMNNLSSTLTAVADHMEKKVVPIAKQSVKSVDRGADSVNTGFVDFLLEHRGIALTLAPGTVIKAVAAYHVDQLITAKTGEKTNSQRMVVIASDSNVA